MRNCTAKVSHDKKESTKIFRMMFCSYNFSYLGLVTFLARCRIMQHPKAMLMDFVMSDRD